MRTVYCKTRARCAEVRRGMMPSVLGVQVHAQLHPLDDVHALVQTLTAGGKLGPYEMVASPGWGKCTDRKSTRLNSSHLGISYAVFCLKKKKKQEKKQHD